MWFTLKLYAYEYVSFISKIPILISTRDDTLKTNINVSFPFKYQGISRSPSIRFFYIYRNNFPHVNVHWNVRVTYFDARRKLEARVRQVSNLSIYNKTFN
jgi:hypothetical protein